MNPRRFDDLSRSVALSTSRRQALKILTASLAGGLFLGNRDASGDSTAAMSKASAAPSSERVNRSLGAVVAHHPNIGPDTFELLSYQSDGYRFIAIPLGARPPSGFEQQDFDDSGFAVGVAPFGGNVDVGCPLDPTIRTLWPIGSELVLRHPFSVPQGAANIRILLSVDNDLIGAFVNGEPVIREPIMHEGCASLDQLRIDVPASVVEPGTDNLIAFHVRDRGVQSFFDVRILAELSSAVLSQTLDETAQAMSTALLAVPSEPVSNVTTSCGSSNRGKTVTINFLIPRTGESGNVHIGAPTRDQRTLAYEVGGQPMIRETITWGDEGRRVNLDIQNSPTLNARKPVGSDSVDPAMTGLNNVLSMPSVSAAIETCLHALDPRPDLSCEANCRTIGKDGHNRIGLGKTGFCAFAGVTGGFAGALGGAWLGGRFGGLVGATAGAAIGGAFCWLESSSSVGKERCWNVWEEQCLACCAACGDANECTKNQPPTVRVGGGMPCSPPAPIKGDGTC